MATPSSSPTMDFEFIRYEVDGHVRRITIDRPESRNALNAACHRELRLAFETFRDDDDAWVAILTGTGTAFCAGQDLKEVGDAQAAGREVSRPEFWGGITRDLDCWKPIIAAVNGHALGGGLELVLACDLVVAADSASFGLPESRRGIAATAGGLVRLPRQLPLKHAMAMVLTGQSITATRAHELGLVNEVVPAADLAEAADRWARAVLASSPSSTRVAKHVALGLLHLPVEEAMVEQQPLAASLIDTEDAAEGIRAFIEKRDPSWVGR